MRITRRHILFLGTSWPSGLATFICKLMDDAHYKFRTYTRGESAWREATRYFNQHANKNRRQVR